MREVGPGGHFFGSAHTLERYEIGLLRPHAVGLAQLRNLAGGRRPTAAQHANRIWKQLLAEHKAPAMEPAVREELEAFVVRRKQEIAAA